MAEINENIRFIRKQLGLTQDQFAQKLGIKRSLVGAYEEGRAEPRLELLHQIASLSHVSLEDFISKDLASAEDKGSGIKDEKLQRGKEILVVTVNEQKKENIELVPVKAAAGYLNGYADAEYVKELPKFHLPILSHGTFRAFEISGDSMLPLMPGTIVVGEYLDSLADLKNGKTYILVTKREGVVYKRVFNYLSDNGKLFLVSDNRHYAPYQVDADDVLEAWSAKAYISVQFPDVEAKNEVTVEQLAGLVLDLQKEIVHLKTESKKK